MRCWDSKTAKTGKQVRDDSIKQFSIQPHPFTLWERLYAELFMPNPDLVSLLFAALLSYISLCSLSLFDLDFGVAAAEVCRLQRPCESSKL